MAGSQTRKKREMKDMGKEPWPFKFPGYFNWRGRGLQQWGWGGTTMAACLLPAPLWSEAAVSDQSTEHWYSEDRLLFAHPGCPEVVRVMCKDHSCGRRGALLCSSAESWRWLKLAAIYLSSFPLEVASLKETPEFQNRYSRNIMPVQWWWGYRFLLLTAPPSSLLLLL